MQYLVDKFMKKQLQNISKNLILATFSILLVLGIFGVGFFIGTESKLRENQSLNAQSPADLGEFWEVWNLIEEKYVPASDKKVVSDEEKIQGAIQGLVSSLGDSYSRFLTPEENKEFNEAISGNFSGVGMEIDSKDNVLTVIAPLKDSPAEKAGIKAGDIILKIDGKVAADLSVDEAVELIRGEKGTTVEIIIAREGEKGSMSFKIVRDNIKIPTLKSEMRKDGIYVISVFNFSAGVEGDFRKALREFVLSKSNKLVIDLRGNPGGYLEAAVDIASWFLPTGKVIVREDFGSNTTEKVFRSKGYNIFSSNLDVVILVDNGSASASEIVAGALKEHGVAKIVGEKTYGKGSVQELIPISDDTSLKLTIARWLTPNGVSISDSGLEPDVKVEQTKEDLKNGIDAQLEEAIKILLKK